MLIQALLQKQILSGEKLAQAKQHAQTKQQSLIAILIDYFNVDANVICTVAAEAYGLEIAKLPGNKTIATDQTIDLKLMLQYQAYPIASDNTFVKLAIADPTILSSLQNLEFLLGVRIKIVITNYWELLSRLNAINNQHFYQHLNHAASAIEFTTRLLREAIFRHASDIHIEPMNDCLRIRMRIDGLLHKIVDAPINMTNSLISHIKVQANLDIAQKRTPQDGRFRFNTIEGFTRDCRLNCTPTQFGEKCVIRVLHANQNILSLAQLGMSVSQQKSFQTSITKPQGLILVTGPTGSGKTMTLYSALNLLNDIHKNIMTIEDPIEIQLPGINQVSVNPKAEMDFATALRSFLRQDPDIIMVGEIRDQETAAIAIRAAQTGHLVLATLHTNNAAQSISRLIHMGIANYQLASVLLCVIAQRLLRCLCAHCKTVHTPSSKTLLQAEINPDDSFTLFAANQCQNCIQGYAGRTGIYECLLIHSEQQMQICNHQYDSLQPTQSLWQHAMEKVKQGQTSLAEAYRVIIP